MESTPTLPLLLAALRLTSSALSTHTSSQGLKTRNFGTIISEITSCLRIHTECNSNLNGVSLEFTGEITDDGFSVTECIGGSMELSEEQLGLRYQSFCDPRLNFEQSLGKPRKCRRWTRGFTFSPRRCCILVIQLSQETPPRRENRRQA